MGASRTHKGSSADDAAGRRDRLEPRIAIGESRLERPVAATESILRGALLDRGWIVRAMRRSRPTGARRGIAAGPLVAGDRADVEAVPRGHCRPWRTTTSPSRSSAASPRRSCSRKFALLPPVPGCLCGTLGCSGVLTALVHRTELGPWAVPPAGWKSGGSAQVSCRFLGNVSASRRASPHAGSPVGNERPTSSP